MTKTSNYFNQYFIPKAILGTVLSDGKNKEL